MNDKDDEITVAITLGEVVRWKSPNLFHIGGPTDDDVRQMLRDKGLDPNARPLRVAHSIDGTVYYTGRRIKK